MKNPMGRLLTADRDDRRDAELEDPSIEMIQSEEQREGRLQNKSLSGLWDNGKRSIYE